MLQSLNVIVCFEKNQLKRFLGTFLILTFALPAHCIGCNYSWQFAPHDRFWLSNKRQMFYGAHQGNLYSWVSHCQRLLTTDVWVGQILWWFWILILWWTGQVDKVTTIFITHGEWWCTVERKPDVFDSKVADIDSQLIFTALRRQLLLTCGKETIICSMAKCTVMAATRPCHQDCCWPKMVWCMAALFHLRGCVSLMVWIFLVSSVKDFDDKKFRLLSQFQAMDHMSESVQTTFTLIRNSKKMQYTKNFPRDICQSRGSH